MSKVLQKGRFKVRADSESALHTYLKQGWRIVEDGDSAHADPPIDPPADPPTEDDYDENGDTGEPKKPPKSKKRG